MTEILSYLLTFLAGGLVSTWGLLALALARTTEERTK
jgi:hypothetical protein